MNICLLLGSFNPITIAHTSIASTLLNSGKFDKILFVVAKHNPWKREKPAPFEVRCQMIETAIQPFEGKCEVCRIEENLPTPTYSYMTIGALKEMYPNDTLFIVGGSDTIQAIPHWKNYETHIKGNVEIIEISRNVDYLFLPPNAINTVAYNELGAFGREKLYGKSIPLIKTKRMDVSSTNVRWLISNGMNPYPLITTEVYNIIKQHNLYKNG